jgi:lipid-binding SYLF domain-containing protein
VDGDANKNLYGDKVSVDQIIQGQGITTPEEAKPLIEQLTAATSKAAPAAQHQ